MKASESNLVGGFNPFEKYDPQIWIISPVGMKIKNIWVATTQESNFDLQTKFLRFFEKPRDVTTSINDSSKAA